MQHYSMDTKSRYAQYSTGSALVNGNRRSPSPPAYSPPPVSPPDAARREKQRNQNGKHPQSPLSSAASPSRRAARRPSGEDVSIPAEARRVTTEETLRHALTTDLCDSAAAMDRTISRVQDNDREVGRLQSRLEEVTAAVDIEERQSFKLAATIQTLLERVATHESLQRDPDAAGARLAVANAVERLEQDGFGLKKSTLGAKEQSQEGTRDSERAAHRVQEWKETLESLPIDSLRRRMRTIVDAAAAGRLDEVLLSQENVSDNAPKQATSPRESKPSKPASPPASPSPRVRVEIREPAPLGTAQTSRGSLHASFLPGYARSTEERDDGEAGNTRRSESPSGRVRFPSSAEHSPSPEPRRGLPQQPTPPPSRHVQHHPQVTQEMQAPGDEDSAEEGLDAFLEWAVQGAGSSPAAQDATEARNARLTRPTASQTRREELTRKEGGEIPRRKKRDVSSGTRSRTPSRPRAKTPGSSRRTPAALGSGPERRRPTTPRRPAAAEEVSNGPSARARTLLPDSVPTTTPTRPKSAPRPRPASKKPKTKPSPPNDPALPRGLFSQPMIAMHQLPPPSGATDTGRRRRGGSSGAGVEESAQDNHPHAPRSYLAEALRDNGWKTSTSASTKPTRKRPASAADEKKRLLRLRDAGEISPEEYLEQLRELQDRQARAMERLYRCKQPSTAASAASPATPQNHASPKKGSAVGKKQAHPRSTERPAKRPTPATDRGVRPSKSAARPRQQQKGSPRPRPSSPSLRRAGSPRPAPAMPRLASSGHEKARKLDADSVANMSMDELVSTARSLLQSRMEQATTEGGLGGTGQRVPPANTTPYARGDSHGGRAPAPRATPGDPSQWSSVLMSAWDTPHSSAPEVALGQDVTPSSVASVPPSSSAAPPLPPPPSSSVSVATPAVPAMPAAPAGMETDAAFAHSLVSDLFLHFPVSTAASQSQTPSDNSATSALPADAPGDNINRPDDLPERPMSPSSRQAVDRRLDQLRMLLKFAPRGEQEEVSEEPTNGTAATTTATTITTTTTTASKSPTAGEDPPEADDKDMAMAQAPPKEGLYSIPEGELVPE